MSAIVDLKGAALVAVTCTRCERQMTPAEWSALELKGHVGHWKAGGKLYAVELRNCAGCSSTLGCEVEDPPMNGSEEVTDL